MKLAVRASLNTPCVAKTGIDRAKEGNVLQNRSCWKVFEREFYLQSRFLGFDMSGNPRSICFAGEKCLRLPGRPHQTYNMPEDPSFCSGQKLLVAARKTSPSL